MHHPLAVVADLLLTLLVLAALGVESPLVLATFSTALIMGILFERRIAILGATALVAGFLLVDQLQASPTNGFMINLGIPALYVVLVAIGSVVRHAHEREVTAARELVDAHRALARLTNGPAWRGRCTTRWARRCTASRWPPRRSPSGSSATRRRRCGTRTARGRRQPGRGRGSFAPGRLRADEPDRPLAQVLADQCRSWAAETGIECVFETHGAVDLSTDARYEALAIVSEALENVQRHADAGRVAVSLAGLPVGRSGSRSSTTVAVSSCPTAVSARRTTSA